MIFRLLQPELVNRAAKPLGLTALLGWLLLLFLLPDTLQLITDYIGFLLLGTVGAIFANATGAGGGVVFIPMFEQLGFTDGQSVATSFAIQCFGMTAGALSWLYYAKITAPLRESSHVYFLRDTLRVIAITSLFSLSGLWLVYGFSVPAPASLHDIFSLFSTLLGIGIILSVYLAKQIQSDKSLMIADIAACGFIGFIGGAITAWLSVGVGEVLAFYLILRGYSVTLAIASAVIVSAITVWGGIIQHAVFVPQIYWHVVLFAGPGAIVGGLVAKYLVLWLSARKVKLFFGFWVFLVGLGTSPLGQLLG